MKDWIKRSWFRHPLSLRPDIGSDTLILDMEVEPNQRKVGLAVYWKWDKGWHASATRFMGIELALGNRVRYFGLKDSN
jgi:hypothetical protein